MGWAGGSLLISDVWATVKPYIPEEKVTEVLVELIQTFQAGDWDTEDEFVEEYPEALEALKIINPEIWNEHGCAE